MLTYGLGALLAIPYGLLADKRGRKWTLCLSIPGFALNSILILAVLWFSDIFPLRTVWLSSLTWVFGGGPVVAFAIIWTMMADVTSEEERYVSFALVSAWLMAMLTGQCVDFLPFRGCQYGGGFHLQRY